MKNIVRICSGLCLFLVAGCADSPYNPFYPSQHNVLDPARELSRDDYRNIYAPKEGEKNAGVTEPPIPELAEVLATPQPPKVGETKLVSVAVTDDVPLKDVLIELARLADVDIEVDAGISGGISFRAKDRPFNEVIDRIANLAGLRYTMKNNVLRVERDTPFIEIYSIDFLNVDRTSSSSMNISTNVLSSGGDGLNSGSQASVSTKTDNDFWKKFEDSLGRILSYEQTSRASGVTVATQPASSVAESETAEPVPAEEAAEATEITTTSGRSFYILNRQAATLTVSATEKQHRLVKEFIRKIQANATSQVLIEAKIVEVTLNDQYQSGINWSRLGTGVLASTLRFGSVTSSDNIATLTLSKDNLTGANIDLDAAVQLTEIFGTTRTLSSPRLHATNNQQAVLTFAENKVYFEIDIEQQENSNAGGTQTSIQVDSTAHTVPIGIILALQPSINTETNEVTLSVRPTLSRITGFVSDPAVTYLLTQLPAGASTSGLSSQVPVVEVRELDSILKLKSGQVMVIGGLMEDKATNDDNGVPGASRVPLFGNLFRGVNRDNDLRELVIFIRARIVDTGGNADNADKAVYEKFQNDPRPLSF